VVGEDDVPRPENRELAFAFDAKGTTRAVELLKEVAGVEVIRVIGENDGEVFVVDHHTATDTGERGTTSRAIACDGHGAMGGGRLDPVADAFVCGIPEDNTATERLKIDDGLADIELVSDERKLAFSGDDFADSSSEGVWSTIHRGGALLVASTIAIGRTTAERDNLRVARTTFVHSSRKSRKRRKNSKRRMAGLIGKGQLVMRESLWTQKVRIRKKGA